MLVHTANQPIAVKPPFGQEPWAKCMQGLLHTSRRFRCWGKRLERMRGFVTNNGQAKVKDEPSRNPSSNRSSNPTSNPHFACSNRLVSTTPTGPS